MSERWCPLCEWILVSELVLQPPAENVGLRRSSLSESLSILRSSVKNVSLLVSFSCAMAASLQCGEERLIEFPALWWATNWDTCSSSSTHQFSFPQNIWYSRGKGQGIYHTLLPMLVAASAVVDWELDQWCRMDFPPSNRQAIRWCYQVIFEPGKRTAM